jgi:hypothetical protein
MHQPERHEAIRTELASVAPIPMGARELAALVYEDVDNTIAKIRVHAAIQRLRRKYGRAAVRTTPTGYVWDGIAAAEVA